MAIVPEAQKAGSSWPPELPAALWPLLPDVADDVIVAIGAEVPIYARPLEGRFGEGVRRGVQDALRGFVELLGDGAGAGGGTGGGDAGGRASAGHAEGDGHRRVSFELGRGEVRQGRSLDALLAAYRVGARITWRHCGAAASELGLSGADLVRLGELLFAVIDALSAAAAEGYAHEQSERIGELDRRRRRLGALLVSGTAGEAALLDAATAASWRPPATLSAVVAAERDAVAPLLADPSVLLMTDEVSAVVLVPDADGPGRRTSLEAALVGAGTSVAVGPAVPWQQAHRSLQRARAALTLADSGVVTRDRPVWTVDVLVPLVLHADHELGADLAAQVLAPLDALPPATRGRLAETLLSWLARQGARALVAGDLHVHPQTVRYRVGQLRELFGDDLDDPDRRFALELALRLRDRRAPVAD